MSTTEPSALTGVTVILENDIVCGRGGAALKHSGNLAYRKIVNLNKTLYATCLKAEKLRISKSIVAAIREVNGRFLEREDGKISTTLEEVDGDGNPVKWKDIGDRRAIEKTSQALREGQPKLLKKLKGMEVGEGVANDNNQGMGIQINMPMGQQQQQQHHQQQMMNPYQYDQANAYNGQQTMQYNNYNNMNYNSAYPQGDPMAAATAAQMQSQMPVQNLRQEHSFNLNEITNSQGSTQHPTMHDSWGDDDPNPLPYNKHSSIDMEFSDQMQLLSALGMENKRESLNSNRSDDGTRLSFLSIGSLTTGSQQGGGTAQPPRGPKRASVTFDVKGRPNLSHLKKSSFGLDSSLMSINSHMSDLSLFETQSLDSAMDVAEREAELLLLGDFDWDNEMTKTGSEFAVTDAVLQTMPPMAVGSGSMDTATNQVGARRSILRRSSRWAQNAFPPAALAEGPDPGMLFTSTFDSKPGGVNSGTDVSGLMGGRRKSVIAFEVRAERRPSMRLSTCSMLTDMSGLFRRDLGSTLSIQSVDIRDLIDMDDDDEDLLDDEKPAAEAVPQQAG
ncbi:predicted protein [Thalassiosira pseudonana CCMP1335]|jgi:hypothetical protein|uniref:DUF6824 domain-containing protein n=1 Tax=Thalassiosira pseudonana TaxID=35128 RepID=B8BVW6_THAPS|nr:predicted protein [Thalassiosira pseudonana CCMP1335]EED95527.1 predicted protein [Thalassiosira pseudonana CCMP1335]|eukprot:scaffold1627_cov164-Alexandrium_tamarense.AAC.23